MKFSSPNPGASPVANGKRSGADRLQPFTLFHVASLVVFASWDFGGETDLARLVICGWGSLSAVILCIACVRRWRSGGALPSATRWLWPLALFNLLVIVSAQNPSFTRTILHGTSMFMEGGARRGWPSSARPDLSLSALWQFDAIFLTCFNLAVVVVERRMLRFLLFVLTVNSLVLAVMGTFQKLARSKGLYFGMVHSPNTSFFASFIYHNHWGAFTVLNTAAALGLLFHHAQNRDQDGRRHSPVFFGLVATLFIAASVPLSGSRSCTALLLAMLAGALFRWIRSHAMKRASAGPVLDEAGPQPGPYAPVAAASGKMSFLRAKPTLNRRLNLRPNAVAIGLALAVFLGGVWAIFLLDRPVIETRLQTTRQQWDDMRKRGDLGGRQQLYADTWHMASDQLWFGWGLGSYATVFGIYNSQYAPEPWFGQPFYEEAHSDWLQSVAEVGLIGTGLLVLTGLLPLLEMFRQPRPWGELPHALLAGCGLIALYAWIEFPFANPAVMLVFWLCFFTAVRYHKLTAGQTPANLDNPQRGGAN